MTWRCSHTMEMPNRRCINCCVTRPQHYVLCAARGGTPQRYRWLCDPCRAEYEAKGMLAGERRTYVREGAVVTTISGLRNERGQFTPEFGQLSPHRGAPIVLPGSLPSFHQFPRGVA